MPEFPTFPLIAHLDALRPSCNFDLACVCWVLAARDGFPGGRQVSAVCAPPLCVPPRLPAAGSCACALRFSAAPWPCTYLYRTAACTQMEKLMPLEPEYGSAAAAATDKATTDAAGVGAGGDASDTKTTGDKDDEDDDVDYAVPVFKRTDVSITGPGSQQLQILYGRASQAILLAMVRVCVCVIFRLGV